MKFRLTLHFYVNTYVNLVDVCQFSGCSPKILCQFSGCSPKIGRGAKLGEHFGNYAKMQVFLRFFGDF